MTMEQQILKEYKIAITGQRLSLLAVFLQNNEPVTHSLLEKRANRTISRYTVYRTLKLFLNKGLLHSLPSEDGIMRYVLQVNNIFKQSHNHVHFICRDCGKIYYLPDTPLPKMTLSKEFNAEAIDVIIKGICTSCK